MKMLMIKQPRIVNDQGFASIVIALTLVIILALMTVGFAQLSRREQRNALNKQLSIQAYYAAESGISDATADIVAGKITFSNPDCKPVPKSGVTDYALNKPSLNDTLGVSYSCVSINLDPTALVYSNVSDSSYRTVSFTNANPSPMASLKISWNSTDGKNIPAPTYVAGKSLLTRTAWSAAKQPALMEVSLTPLGTVDRDSLIKNDFTAYGYPATNPSPGVVYGSSASATEGTVTNAHCDASSVCSLSINGLTGNGNVPYLLHLTNHYDVSNVTVTGLDILGNAVKFHGGQAVIDSTGRARDVLKRLQVHIPLVQGNGLSNYAIEAQSVCKRIATYPNDVTKPDGSSSDTFYDPSSSGTGGIASSVGDPCNLN
jgi:Tfp pilus assembly protein PilX